eukprot:gene9398-biopygen13768
MAPQASGTMTNGAAGAEKLKMAPQAPGILKKNEPQNLGISAWKRKPVNCTLGFLEIFRKIPASGGNSRGPDEDFSKPCSRHPRSRTPRPAPRVVSRRCVAPAPCPHPTALRGARRTARPARHTPNSCPERACH